ncbi:MAG: hypothetical protein U1G08_11765 [Verrucomicrobiota bacterium]
MRRLVPILVRHVRSRGSLPFGSLGVEAPTVPAGTLVSSEILHIITGSGLIGPRFDQIHFASTAVTNEGVVRSYHAAMHTSHGCGG